MPPKYMKYTYIEIIITAAKEKFFFQKRETAICINFKKN